LAFLGGLGILVYVIMVLVVPLEGTEAVAPSNWLKKRGTYVTRYAWLEGFLWLFIWFVWFWGWSDSSVGTPSPNYLMEALIGASSILLTIGSVLTIIGGRLLLRGELSGNIMSMYGLAIFIIGAFTCISGVAFWGGESGIGFWSAEYGKSDILFLLALVVILISLAVFVLKWSKPQPPS
jgi:hypothetical protein